MIWCFRNDKQSLCKLVTLMLHSNDAAIRFHRLIFRAPSADTIKQRKKSNSSHLLLHPKPMSLLHAIRYSANLHYFRPIRDLTHYIRTYNAVAVINFIFGVGLCYLLFQIVDAHSLDVLSSKYFPAERWYASFTKSLFSSDRQYRAYCAEGKACSHLTYKKTLLEVFSLHCSICLRGGIDTSAARIDLIITASPNIQFGDNINKRCFVYIAAMFLIAVFALISFAGVSFLSMSITAPFSCRRRRDFTMRNIWNRCCRLWLAITLCAPIFQVDDDFVTDYATLLYFIFTSYI